MGQLHWQGATEAKEEERERKGEGERKTKGILKCMYFSALWDSLAEREKKKKRKIEDIGEEERG